MPAPAATATPRGVMEFREFAPLVLPSILAARMDLSAPPAGTRDGIHIGLFTTLYSLYRTYTQTLAIVEERGDGGRASVVDLEKIAGAYNDALVQSEAAKGGAFQGPASRWPSAPMSAAQKESARAKGEPVKTA